MGGKKKNKSDAVSSSNTLPLGSKCGTDAGPCSDKKFSQRPSAVKPHLKDQKVKGQKTYSFSAAATEMGAASNLDRSVLKVLIESKLEQQIINLINCYKQQHGGMGTVSGRLTAKKLQDLYMALQGFSFKAEHVEKAMENTILYGGDLHSALDWLCLNLPNDALPEGFSQKLQEEEKKNRPKFQYPADLVKPTEVSEIKKAKDDPVRKGTAKQDEKETMKKWILRYAEQESEDEIGDEDVEKTFENNEHFDPNERYLELTAKLSDAKEEASAAKDSKNKQVQQAAQEKIRSFNDVCPYERFYFVMASECLASPPSPNLFGTSPPENTDITSLLVSISQRLDAMNSRLTNIEKSSGFVPPALLDNFGGVPPGFTEVRGVAVASEASAVTNLVPPVACQLLPTPTTTGNLPMRVQNISYSSSVQGSIPPGQKQRTQRASNGSIETQKEDLHSTNTLTNGKALIGVSSAAEWINNTGDFLSFLQPLCDGLPVQSPMCSKDDNFDVSEKLKILDNKTLKIRKLQLEVAYFKQCISENMVPKGLRNNFTPSGLIKENVFLIDLKAMFQKQGLDLLEMIIKHYTVCIDNLTTEIKLLDEEIRMYVSFEKFRYDYERIFASIDTYMGKLKIQKTKKLFRDRQVYLSNTAYPKLANFVIQDDDSGSGHDKSSSIDTQVPNEGEAATSTSNWNVVRRKSGEEEEQELEELIVEITPLEASNCPSIVKNKKGDFTIYNFSSLTLEPELVELLSLGYNFVPSRHFDVVKVLIDLKCFVRKLNLKLLFNNSNNEDRVAIKLPSVFNPPLHVGLRIFENACELDIRHLHNTKGARKSIFNISKEQLQALNQLKESSVRVMKPDKGGGLVVFEHDLYNEKMSLVLDTPAYNHSSLNEMNINIHRIKGYFRDLFIEGRIDLETYEYINITQPRTPVMFGIPKIHKNLGDPPMRALVDGRSSISYPSAKYIDSMLNKYLEYLPSIFDVVDLYTSIPHLEAIEWLELLLSELKAPRDVISNITELLDIVLSSNFFVFGKEFYIQKQGVAMGSPCGAIVANLFMAHWERKFVLNHPLWKNRICFYTRFLDDIFILFKGNEEEARLLIEYFNSTTTFLRFTSKFDTCEIDYLDVKLKKDIRNLRFISSIYRKDTYINSFLHYTSAHPYKLKKAIIKGQLIRAVRMCSELKGFEEECTVLREFFLDRGYPPLVIEEMILEVSNKRRNGILSPLILDHRLVNGSEQDMLTEGASTDLGPVTVIEEPRRDFSLSFSTVFSLNSKEISDIIVKNWVKIPRSADDVLSVCPTILTEDSMQSQHLAATLALYHLVKGQSVHQLLPPTYRDVWLEWSDAEKKKEEQNKMETSKPRDQFITKLLNKLKQQQQQSKHTLVTSEETEESWENLVSLNDFDNLSLDQKHPQGFETARSLFKTLQCSAKHKKLLKDRQQLPVFLQKNTIVETLRRHRVVVVAGETGSGKSTQIPQFLLEDLLASKSEPKQCNIVCTQPRRISAVSLATRVNDEMGSEDGPGGKDSLCGYQIRMESKAGTNTRLLYCTTGVLLRKMQHDGFLSNISHVVVDEVHERSVQSDFLLIILKELLQKRLDLHLILMSATVDSDKFAKYFGHCPVISIPGRTFPVEVFHLEDVIEKTGFVLEQDSEYCQKFIEEEEEITINCTGKGGRIQKHQEYVLKETRPESNLGAECYQQYSSRTRHALQCMNHTRINMDLILELLDFLDKSELFRSMEGAVLIFLPGLADIQHLYDLLCSDRRFRAKDRYKLIALHSILSSQDQAAAFTVPPQGIRKIVLATNIAETGITIPDVVFVIDTGKTKENRYHDNSQMSSLVETFVSKASALQRQGRAGRVREGFCFRLYTEERYQGFNEYSVPEILRVPLEELCLHIMKCNLGSPEDFLRKALDPPQPQMVSNAMNLLRKTGACEMDQAILTPLGQHLAALPVNVKIGKMLIFGAIFGCLEPVATIAAAITEKSPFSTPMNRKDEADLAKAALAVANSDHLTIYNAYLGWKKARSEGYRAEMSYCRKHFLSRTALLTIEDLKQELIRLVETVGFVAPSRRPLTIPGSDTRGLLSPNEISFLKSVLTAGLYDNVAKIIYVPSVDIAEKAVCTVETAQGKAQVHPSSVNRGLQTYGWLLFQEKVKYGKVYIRDTSVISPFPILLFGGEIDVQHREGLLSVDGWIHFQAPVRIGVIFKQLRNLIDSVLKKKLENPKMSLEDDKTIQIIMELIKTENGS
ncbi:ATP-dependent RNA helicase DHX29 [Protopterus annectens]|uniref:ATP-dependent RNA helicase DHX29 n=1 Tax=Protopterus annectens TaxID=7888 RepID=UPI001CFA5ED5|nr:ATP-dependent RNA helicase DHX29 [Protopterus annectens]